MQDAAIDGSEPGADKKRMAEAPTWLSVLVEALSGLETQDAARLRGEATGLS
jgi:hypothetical protein